MPWPNHTVLALSTLFLGTPLPAASSWDRAPIPVDHARVLDMQLAPSLPTRVYLSLRGLGVWRTDDRGLTWSDQSAGFPPDVVVLGLAVHESDAGFVLAGSAASAGVAGTLYRSTDAGNTWTESASGLLGESVQAVEFDPSNPAVAYAGTSGGSQPGVYQSTDSGLTWAYLTGAIPGEAAYVIDVNPSDPAGIVIGTQDGRAVTTDTGITWSSSFAGLGYRDFAWSPTSTDRLYGAQSGTFGSAGPSRSTDQGQSFDALASLPYISEVHSVAVHPTDAEIVLAGGSHQQSFSSSQMIWRSTDGGANWTETFGSGWGGHLRALAIDPLAPDHYYFSDDALTGDGFRHSSDAGISWTQRIAGLPNYAIGRLAEGPSGGVHAVSHTHHFSSTGSPTTWIDRGNRSAGYEPFGQIDGLVTGPTAGVLFRYGRFSEIDISGAMLMKSTDSGVTWYPFGFGDSYLPPGLDWDAEIMDVAVDGASGQRVYVTQEGTGLWRNDFGGGDYFGNNTYTLINASLGSARMAVFPSAPLSVIFAGGPLTLELSGDGGVTTIARNAGLPAVGGGLEIVDLFLRAPSADLISVVYSDGRVFESTDLGGTWALRFSLDLQGAELRDVTWDPVSGHIFLATVGAGIVTAHPGIPAGLPTGDTESVLYVPSQEMLYVGTTYAGLWYGTVTSAVGAPVVATTSLGQLTVRPNPFAGSTQVELMVSGSGASVSLDVYDTAGRQVRSLFHGWRPAGRQVISWGGRSAEGQPLPAGVYFLRAELDGKVTSRKVVLQR